MTIETHKQLGKKLDVYTKKVIEDILRPHSLQELWELNERKPFVAVKVLPGDSANSLCLPVGFITPLIIQIGINEFTGKQVALVAHEFSYNGQYYSKTIVATYKAWRLA